MQILMKTLSIGVQCSGHSSALRSAGHEDMGRYEPDVGMSGVNLMRCVV